MSKFDDFFNYAQGKAWDKYGKSWNISTPGAGDVNFAGQCVSLIKTYLLYLYPGQVKDSYGNAIDYWTGRSYNGILDLCTVANDLKNGDIVVSDGSDPTYGHIFIYKDGQAFCQNCNDNPRATLYPLSWQGAIVGILRPKILYQSTPNLIPEHRYATVNPGHNINIRSGSPTGPVVRIAKAGTRVEYTDKVVTNGHRYVSWIENGKRMYMAVSPTEAQKDLWVTITPITSKNNYTLIPEHRIATVKKGHNINIRAVAPDGKIVRTAPFGTKIEYTDKTVTNGHRYVSWIEKGVRMFMAVTPTEAAANYWVTISLVPGAKPVEPVKKKGIDVSEAQGEIDFKAVKASGVQFVIPRCGYGSEAEDKYYESYVNGAKAAGVEIPGVYVFSYALTVDQAVAEADFIVSMAKKMGLPGSTILFYDCEYDTVNWAKRNGVNFTASMAQQHTRAFMDRVKAKGYRTGYYANLDWKNTMYNGFATTSDEVFWFARYNDRPEYKSEFQQYSSTGQVNGISGSSVDLDYWNTTTTGEESDTPAAPSETWNPNGIVEVGSTVKSISLPIAVVPGTDSAIQNNCVYVPQLGGLVPLDDVSEASDTGDGACDGYLANLSARVYLDPVEVTDINIPLNLAYVHNYWVNSEPLMVKE